MLSFSDFLLLFFLSFFPLLFMFGVLKHHKVNNLTVIEITTKVGLTGLKARCERATFLLEAPGRVFPAFLASVGAVFCGSWPVFHHQSCQWPIGSCAPPCMKPAPVPSFLH